MPTIGLIGVGEMGAGIGHQLVAAGHKVLTCLQGRSPETIARANEAELQLVETLVDLVARSTIIFSIVPPAVAEEVARTVAAIARANTVDLTFVEANAVSPALLKRVARAFEGTNCTLVDGGIVGSPPSSDRRPRLYCSGPLCHALSSLDGIAFDIVSLGTTLGDASGFKMTYAGMTKGTNALLTAVLLAACKQGFFEEFVDEIRRSQPELARRAAGNIPRLPADAGRWVREMREVCITFEALGLPDGFYQAAAAIMQLLADSRFGSETRRTRDESRSMSETIKTIANDRRQESLLDLSRQLPPQNQ